MSKVYVTTENLYSRRPFRCDSFGAGDYRTQYITADQLVDVLNSCADEMPGSDRSLPPRTYVLRSE